MKVSEIGEIKHKTKKRGSEKPNKRDRKSLKQLRKFKRNNS